MPLFAGVLTTASVSIVDKAGSDGRWSYYDVQQDFRVQRRAGVTANKNGPLDYSGRGKVWALRGLSPGSQKVFTLSEGERIHFGLTRNDVLPCVTTLKHCPPHMVALTRVTFRKHFIESGARCWLIKSYKSKRSETLGSYLNSVPAIKRDTYTCHNQTPWFNFLPHPVPQLLVGSGFVNFAPKVLVNSVGAIAVGSTFGVHSEGKLPLNKLQCYLRAIDFESRVVPHAKTLRKIEVKQLNSVLKAFSRTFERGKASR